MKISEVEPALPAQTPRRRAANSATDDPDVSVVDESDSVQQRFDRNVQDQGRHRQQNSGDNVPAPDGTEIDETEAKALAVRARQFIGRLVLDRFNRRTTVPPREYLA